MRTWLVAVLAITWTAPTARALEPLRVAVSIQPQAGLIERLAGEGVAVTVLVGPGHSPVTYEPSPRQLAALADSKLFVRIGVPFERGFIERLRQTYPRMRIVDQRSGVALRMLSGHAHGHADHGHDPESADPHIWLDPKRLAIQAANLASALVAVAPERADTVISNLAGLGSELARLDARIEQVLGPHRGRPVFVFHPAFGYFTESYGLEQVAVETGGKEPSARQLAALIERARAAGARVLFVQPQFSEKSARLVAEAVRAAVVPMDPLARDVLANLNRMAQLVNEALNARGTDADGR